MSVGGEVFLWIVYVMLYADMKFCYVKFNGEVRGAVGSLILVCTGRYGVADLAGVIQGVQVVCVVSFW